MVSFSGTSETEGKQWSVSWIFFLSHISQLKAEQMGNKEIPKSTDKNAPSHTNFAFLARGSGKGEQNSSSTATEKRGDKSI